MKSGVVSVALSVLSGVALVAVATVLVSCTTGQTAQNSRTPASEEDSASDRLHDQKIHNFLERTDTHIAR
jgi:hypothetical protein